MILLVQRKFLNPLKTVIIKKVLKKRVNVDLIVLHTEWDEFKSLEFNKIVKNKSYSVFDLRNLYDQKQMKNKKIKYFSVGRPSSL